MDDPVLSNNETVLLTIPDVLIKSVPFEAILTDKRIILLDRGKNPAPQKDIPLRTIRAVEAGENALRDPVLTLSVITDGNKTRQMIITFPRHGGGGRIRERDDWSGALRNLVSTSARGEGSFPGEQEYGIGDAGPADTGRAGRPATISRKREVRVTIPIEKIPGPEVSFSDSAGAPPHPHGSFCTRCGNRLAEGSVFCSRCGAKVVTAGLGPSAQERPEPGVSMISRPQQAVPAKDGPLPPEKTHRSKGAGQSRPVGEKRSLFSRLFPKGRSRKKPVLAEKETPPPRHPARDVPGSPGRPIIPLFVIAVVVILIVAGGAFVYFTFFRAATGEPAGSPGGTGAVTTTAPSAGAATPAITPVRTEPTPVIIPSDGVYVRVSYLGAWRGSYGVAGAQLSAVQSGDVSLKVENATGMVQASFRKDDSSTRPHELVVEIYRNGALVKRGVTTEPKGQVEISVNIATATPITVSTTVAGKSPVT